MNALPACLETDLGKVSVYIQTAYEEKACPGGFLCTSICVCVLASPSTMWVPGLKLRRSGLAAGGFPG